MTPSIRGVSEISSRVVLTGFAALALVVACDLPGKASDVPQWTLTETLRIGTMEEGPASFDGWFKAVDADAQGRVWVLDRQTQEIRVFSPDGAFLMNVGRKGAGPGEFQNAEGFSFAKDGRLWVKDAANARLSVFSSDGTFEDSRATTFCYSQGMWDPVMVQPERIIAVDCAVREGRAQGDLVVGYRTDLSGVDTIADVTKCGDDGLAESATFITRSGTSTRYQGVPWAPQAIFAVGGAAETWCVPNSSRFEILRIMPGGRDTTRITAVVADVPVTQAERDSVIAGFEEKGPSGLDFTRIPRVKPAIDRLSVDDEGQLWVWSTDSHGALEFRIYSMEGKPVAVARISGHKLETYEPFVVRGNAIYATSQDHEDVPIVLRFTIGRGSP